MSDRAIQERQLVALKTFNSNKAKFSEPNVYQTELWRKIAETVREICPCSDYYGAKECRDEINSIKRKYYKVKNGKLEVTGPDDVTLMEEAKLAFETTEPVSDSDRQKRKLAALKAYNLYKDEFSVSNACEPKLWGEVAKKVREECPNNGFYGAQQCRDEVRSIKNKYFKGGKGKLEVTSPDELILIEEAKLAFGNIGNGSTKKFKPNKQKDDLGLLRAYNQYKDELYSCPEYHERAVWKKIAKQVRINRSVNGISGYNEKHCRNGILALKLKYEKKKYHKSKIANPDEAILLNEAELAFGDPEFQGYGYRRGNYGSGHGSNSQGGPPSALNNGIMEYERDYTRDNYDSDYRNNSQHGPPYASNDRNESESSYQRDNYGGLYGTNQLIF